jgi:hypothetical protein
MNPRLEILGSYYSSPPVSNAYVHDGAVVRGKKTYKWNENSSSDTILYQ